MMDKQYSGIVAHYEKCLEKYGDTHRGVDWPSLDDARLRYKIMLELLKKPMSTLLDFGCGTGHLYEYMLDSKIENIHYSGLDISEKFVSVARNKFPGIEFYCLDIMRSNVELPLFDYIIMNGVFTEKINLSNLEMFSYFQEMLIKIFAKVNIGLAFNVMSKNVEWERDDLFHLSIDQLSEFLTKKISRHFEIRHDYGLYDYTVYVYKQPNR